MRIDDGGIEIARGKVSNKKHSIACSMDTIENKSQLKDTYASE